MATQTSFVERLPGPAKTIARKLPFSALEAAPPLLHNRPMQDPDRLISAQSAAEDTAIDRAIRPKTLAE
ncbi:MAG: hypothetical protein WBM63_17545, partial [Sedimenticolaceae bacterium]